MIHPFKKQGVSFMLLVSTIGVYAQSNSTPILLQQAIDSAMSHNEQIKQAILNTRIAGEQKKQTKAIFLPVIELSHSALFSNDPLNAFGFKLQQGSVGMADFNPEKLNNPGVSKDFTTQLQIMQPIFNMDAIYQRKAASKMKEMAQWSETRLKEYIRFAVKKAYMEIHLAYRAYEVLEKAKQTALTMNERAKDMYEQGLIQRADLLESEVHLRKVENELTIAKSNINNSSDLLSSLMGVPLNTIWEVSGFPSQIDQTASVTSVNSRSDILAYKAGLAGLKAKINSEKMTFVPRINAFGSYNLHDTKLFGVKSDSYFAGIKLSWTIFNGSRNIHKIKESKLEYAKMDSKIRETVDQANLEIAQNQRQLQDIATEIIQTQIMVEQATESLAILQDRYEQGLAVTSDLLRVQTQLAQTKMALEVALFKKHLTAAYLLFISSNQ